MRDARWLFVLGTGAALLVLAESAFGVGVIYHSAAVRGHVVSAENGSPIQGATVLALWSADVDRRLPLMVNVLYASEVESDSAGRFMIPAWESATLRAPVNRSSPRIVVLARGYDLVGIEAPSPDALIRLRLGRADRSAKRAEQLRGLVLLLVDAWVPLYGEQPPRMLAVADSEWQELPQTARANDPSPRAVFAWRLRELRTAIEDWSIQK